MSHPVALLSTRSMEDSASLLVGGQDIPFILFIIIQLKTRAHMVSNSC